MVALLSLVVDGFFAILPYLLLLVAGYGIFRLARGRTHQVLSRTKELPYTFLFTVPAHLCAVISKRGKLSACYSGLHVLFPWNQIVGVFALRPTSFGEENLVYRLRTSDRYEVQCRIVAEGSFDDPVLFMQNCPETPSWSAIVREEIAAIVGGSELEALAVPSMELIVANRLWANLNQRFQNLKWGLRVTLLTVQDWSVPEDRVLRNAARQFLHERELERIRTEHEQGVLEARVENDTRAARILERGREAIALTQQGVDAILQYAALEAKLARQQLASVTELKILSDRGKVLIELRGSELAQLADFYAKERESLIPCLGGENGARFTEYLKAITVLTMLATLGQQTMGRGFSIPVGSIVTATPGVDANSVIEILSGRSSVTKSNEARKVS